MKETTYTMKENPYQIGRNGRVINQRWKVRTKDFPWSSSSTFKAVCSYLQRQDIMAKTVSEVDFLIKKLKIVMYHIHLKAAFFLNTGGCKNQNKNPE